MNIRTILPLVAWVLCVTRGLAQDAYALAYNVLFIPRYEYLNTMAMSEKNKDYYSAFIIAYHNKGNAKLPINDEYEILTSKGEKHKPGFHPLVEKDIENRRKFNSVGGKVKSIDPGETKYQLVVFDLISDATPAFRLHMRGLPGANGEPDKFQVVVDYEHLKEQIEKNPQNAKDPHIVWEKEPERYAPNREVARWRMKQMLRAENK